MRHPDLHCRRGFLCRQWVTVAEFLELSQQLFVGMSNDDDAVIPSGTGVLLKLEWTPNPTASVLDTPTLGEIRGKMETGLKPGWDEPSVVPGRDIRIHPERASFEPLAKLGLAWIPDDVEPLTTPIVLVSRDGHTIAPQPPGSSASSP